MPTFTFLARQSRNGGVYTSPLFTIPATLGTVTIAINSNNFQQAQFTNAAFYARLEVTNDGGNTWQTIAAASWRGGPVGGKSPGWDFTADLEPWQGYQARAYCELTGTANLGLTLTYTLA